MGERSGEWKCSLPDCKRREYAKGLCQPHYRKAWREKKAQEKADEVKHAS